MPNNRPGSLQVIDPVLTGLARRYQTKGFIQDQLVKNFPVSTLSGQYPVFYKDGWFANDPDNTAKDRAPSKEIDFDWTTETYLCKEYALKVSITDLERQQAHPSLRLERSKNEFLSLHMTIAREKRIADILFPTDVSASFSTKGQLAAGLSATPSTKWDAASGADPEADIRTGQLALYDRTGVLANTLVLPYKVAYHLATNRSANSFRNTMVYTVNGQDMISVGDGILPSQIHGMRVLIAKGPKIQTNNEGGTFAMDDIWGDHARLLYVSDSSEWGIPSVLYRFNHTPLFTSRWRTNDPDIDYVRQWERCDEKVVAPEGGYVITDTLT